MKKLNFVYYLFILLYLTACAVPYSRLKHYDTPYMTKGTYQVFRTIGRLTRKRYDQKIAGHFPYVVNGAMRADEFVDTAAKYSDKLVSFSGRIESEDTDLMRFIWDYQPKHFGASAPNPLLFPYPQDAEHINNYYYIKFIPVTEFQKLKPKHIWDNSAILSGLKFKDVLYLSRGGMEQKGGFIDSNYPELYNNCFSALGMVMQFHMIDNSIVKCYVITSDMYDKDSPKYVRWKIKI